MIRVVLDTNVLISALLQPQGLLPAQVLLVIIAGSAARLCLSGEVYAEYEEVIRRPRQPFSHQARHEAFAAGACRAVVVPASEI
jgi:predicted nucleic acid-binding protein